MFLLCRFIRSSLGPCTEVWGGRALKRVIQQTKRRDTQKEHSCIQHLFALYHDFLQTSPWKYQSRDTCIQTQLFRTCSRCVYTAAPAAGVDACLSQLLPCWLCHCNQPHQDKAERAAGCITCSRAGWRLEYS